MPQISGVSDSEESAAYSDFEVQHATAQLGITDDDTVGDAEVVYSLEPLGGDLDNDEVAQLVAMRRTAFGKIKVDGSFQTATGQMSFEGGTAINTPNRDQFIQNRTGDNEGQIDVIDQEGDAFELNSTEFEEPEQLDYFSNALAAPFNEATDGSGGSNPVGFFEERFVDFAELFGEGPYLDRTDQMNIFMEMDKSNVTYGGRLQTQLTLYWDVFRLDDTRSTLAPPRAD